MTGSLPQQELSSLIQIPTSFCTQLTGLMSDIPKVMDAPACKRSMDRGLHTATVSVVFPVGFAHEALISPRRMNMSTKKGTSFKRKRVFQAAFFSKYISLGPVWGEVSLKSTWVLSAKKDLRYNLWRKLSPEALTNPTKCVTFLT